MWMMSVPIATCTVTGNLSRAAAATTLECACGGLRRPRGTAPTAWPIPRPLATPSLIAPIQQPARLFRHAEAPGAERFVDVLGGRSRERELEVVNDAGAVGRDRRDEAALHQIDQDRREPRLHDVRAEAPEDARGRSRAPRRIARDDAP